MRKLIYLLVLNLLVACNEATVFITPENDNIYYQGRIDTTNLEKYDLFWSGSSIKISFKGPSVKVLLKDERGENYYNVILDDSVIDILYMDSTKRWYKLASNLKDVGHTLEIFKRTEYDRGKTSFYGFEIPKNSLLCPIPKNKRIIEFFGNSITCGYAVENYSGNDSPDSIYTNNYLTYAAITARHFDADYYCTSKSGIGIMISWFDYTIHKVWDKLNPMDPESKWDFTKIQPDIVVVNLFQNDSWLVDLPERKEFKEIFGTHPPNEKYIINSYIEFIKKVRSVYPNSNIICALGSMDATRDGSPWPGYVTKAVNILKLENSDNKIFTCFFPFKDTPGHPRIEEQQVMANSLIDLIDHNIKW